MTLRLFLAPRWRLSRPIDAFVDNLKERVLRYLLACHRRELPAEVFNLLFDLRDLPQMRRHGGLHELHARDGSGLAMPNLHTAASSWTSAC